jgi:hypothetical protein
MVEAQALIIYGDGGQALYYDEKNLTTDRDGIRVQPILVAPSIELRDKFGLKEEDIPIITEDKKRAIWMEYPIQQLDWLCKSKKGAVLFIWCAFNRDKTPIMRKMDSLLEWDEQRDKTESRHRALISTLQREMEDIQINIAESMRQKQMVQSIIEKKVDDTEGGE